MRETTFIDEEGRKSVLKVIKESEGMSKRFSQMIAQFFTEYGKFLWFSKEGHLQACSFMDQTMLYGIYKIILALFICP